MALKALAAALCLAATLPAQAATTLTVKAGEAGKPISPDLVGVFFEDLNYAADGGLYAELVQNRSFEYQATEQRGWNNLTTWELVQRNGGAGKLDVAEARPLHARNPHYAVIEAKEAGGVGLANGGFDGISVQAGEAYDLSLFAQWLFVDGHWDKVAKEGPVPISVQLESADGSVLAKADFSVKTRAWQRFSARLTPSRTDEKARLVVLVNIRGGVAFDDISLFPHKTFRGRANGLRADLGEAVAALKPKFIRFPGGCLVHGNGLGNMYRWKDTIGPTEQRRQQANLWGYHQTVGLGYFEYFQFAEDIGAKPLPVVPAGVCCQNSGNVGGTGQEGIPLESMGDYIQEVLDLIEYANGPVTSKWGAARAAAGHPEPFHLQYLGVGNEDKITPLFKKRFQMIHDAIKAQHPEITIIGTVGPAPDGEDYERGWDIARELKVAMVDEHYYKPPQWFWDHAKRYDAYDRSHSGVYVGEYAAHEDKRESTLRVALAEAAHLTDLERNGDVVRMASYAPLLARKGHTQWSPDLIYFDGTRVFPTISYSVQQLFGVNHGDRYLGTAIKGLKKGDKLAASTVRDSASGDVILKIVNGDNAARAIGVELGGADKLAKQAQKTVLADADVMAVNDYDKQRLVLPQTSAITVGARFSYQAPANSLTVIRIPRSR